MGRYVGRCVADVGRCVVVYSQVWAGVDGRCIIQAYSQVWADVDGCFTQAYSPVWAGV